MIFHKSFLLILSFNFIGVQYRSLLHLLCKLMLQWQLKYNTFCNPTLKVKYKCKSTSKAHKSTRPKPSHQTLSKKAYKHSLVFFNSVLFLSCKCVPSLKKWQHLFLKSPVSVVLFNAKAVVVSCHVPQKSDNSKDRIISDQQSVLVSFSHLSGVIPMCPGSCVSWYELTL